MMVLLNYLEESYHATRMVTVCCRTYATEQALIATESYCKQYKLNF